MELPQFLVNRIVINDEEYILFDDLTSYLKENHVAGDSMKKVFQNNTINTLNGHKAKPIEHGEKLYVHCQCMGLWF